MQHNAYRYFYRLLPLFIIFHETLSQPKIVGIILAFIGLFCILNKSNEQSAVSFKGILGLIGVWFGYGTIDILFKQVAKKRGCIPNHIIHCFLISRLCHVPVFIPKTHSMDCAKLYWWNHFRCIEFLQHPVLH